MQDVTGQRFGRLTAVAFSHKDKYGAYVWSVVCDCGTSKQVALSNLRGKTKSCGCLKREVNRAMLTTHGLSGTRTHRIWKGLLTRCYTKSATGFANYGAIGIGVCPEWRASYESFIADMGECPPGHSIERVDNDKDYSPDNCVWLPSKEQARNTRFNKRLVPDAIIPLVGLTDRSEISYDTVRGRLSRGWSALDALSAPIGTKPKARRITAGGETLTVASWAARLKMSARSLHHRLQCGWPEVDAVLTPKGAARPIHEVLSKSSPVEISVGCGHGSRSPRSARCVPGRT